MSESIAARSAPRLSFTPKHHRQLRDGNWTLDLAAAWLMGTGSRRWSCVDDQLLRDRLAEARRIEAEGGVVVFWDAKADNSEVKRDGVPRIGGQGGSP